MFSQLFFRSGALARHLSAPLVHERGQYLNHCAAQGMSRKNLRGKAWILLSTVEYLRLAERPGDIIKLSEIETAATRWSRHNRQTTQITRSQRHFITEASRWLTFLNRLNTPPKLERASDMMLAEFGSFMRDDRGLSPITVEYRCRTVLPFLERLLGKGRSLESVSVSDVDSLLLEKVNEGHYARISVRAYASSLRAFFRYAEFRGWCRAGISASVMAPRVFQHETLPSGPSWEAVQEILDDTAGDHPTDIRDHALLLLFAIYGVRSGEVSRLRLSDIDWERDKIAFTRSKRAGRHEFPLLPTVGDAIIRYLKEARPKSPHRQIFLTTYAPIGPLSRGAIWFAVSRRLRERAPLLRHFGPHSLRHACATRLINEGLTLKEVGDQLGQRNPDATRIYAKVDLVRLREVATFDLGELL
jgi:site-specific recombinase XerD